jgi:hypothetical protein
MISGSATIKDGLAEAPPNTCKKPAILAAFVPPLSASPQISQQRSGQHRSASHLFERAKHTRRRRGCPSSQISDAPAAGTDAPAIALFVGHLATRFFC